MDNLRYSKSDGKTPKRNGYTKKFEIKFCQKIKRTKEELFWNKCEEIQTLQATQL